MRYWTPIAATTLAAATLALAGASLAEAKTQVTWWHAFAPEGKLGQTLIRFTEEFNASQDEFEVVPVHKGSYYETLNAAIAAYRAKKHPVIVQVVGRGANTMMLSGAVYPVHQLMQDTGNDIDWSRFIAPVLAAFSDDTGPAAMPFNTSTPILWYNVEAFEKAGIDKAPRTWDELGEAGRRVKAAGYKCGITSAWQIWVHRDNYSFIQDQPIATKGNGMDGLDAEFVYNKTRFVDQVTRVRDWIKEGIYTYTGRTWQGGHEAFYAQQCPIFLESSAGYGGIEKNATFKFAASYLPVEADNAEPKNSFLGGAALWVMKGHDKAQYEGAAKFFAFLASPEKQLDWHKNTGYVPISLDAYEMGKKEGYYEQYPHQEVAILSLNRTPPTANTRGTRLGFDVENTEILNEELERVWALEKEPQAALDDAVRRSNDNLRRFERTASASN
jgi:sn-glycerol 3-phosphate transport system substrate-binding protein